jgi:magnesium chelatase family protein
VRRYRARLSGPLLDRIDVRLEVPRITRARQLAAADPAANSSAGPGSTAEARIAIVEARERMARRLVDTEWSVNGEVSGRWLRESIGRSPSGTTADVDRAVELGTLTMRGWDRVVRLAWTLADLDHAAAPDRSHVRAALALRSAL